ncbi:MAG: 4Fe-4S dicluster domain-containing protein [Proteobacteria bacterium]|nr:4Fe-4S dicluster domain-containing protein [Pseudomonadota bacterium]MBU1594007.1 4Fe-4S dicluster domain-containing protein [Pseudomonadota bacterium]
MVDRYLADSALASVVAAWALDHRVLAPVREGAAIVYRVFTEDTHPFLGRPPTSSAKEALLPQTGDLFTYLYRKDRADLTRTEVFLSEPPPPEPTLILGPRPCDARGRHLLDRVFLERGVIDPQYSAHRAGTLFVSVACTSMQNTCFCHWTGGGMDDESGSDVLLHPLGTGGADGFVARAVTPAGEKLIAALPEATAAMLEELAAARAAAPAPEAAPDLSAVADAFLAMFGDLDFWTDQSARCLSCGVCTYLCPTCSCFNITDENSGMKGRRLRTWDTCMSALYTLEGSGHNPRFSRAHRLRNRVGHKFCYHPREFPQAAAAPSGLEFSCTGCGRCIKSCPVAVDIRGIVLDILAAAAEKAEGAP